MSSSALSKRSSPGLPIQQGGVDGEESVERGGVRGKVRGEGEAQGAFITEREVVRIGRAHV